MEKQKEDLMYLNLYEVAVLSQQEETADDLYLKVMPYLGAPQRIEMNQYRRAVYMNQPHAEFDFKYYIERLRRDKFGGEVK